MSPEFFTFIYDYGGLLIGLVLLVVASLFLPSKIRLYVLTAGLTLFIFRAWQIYNGRKQLKEADAEREILRDKHQDLQQWIETLQLENEKLHNENENIKKEHDRLRQESEVLDETTEENIRKKNELNKKTEQLLQDSEKNESVRAKQLSAIEKAIALKRQYSNLAGETAHE